MYVGGDDELLCFIFIRCPALKQAPCQQGLEPEKIKSGGIAGRRRVYGYTFSAGGNSYPCLLQEGKNVKAIEDHLYNQRDQNRGEKGVVGNGEENGT